MASQSVKDKRALNKLKASKEKAEEFLKVTRKNATNKPKSTPNDGSEIKNQTPPDVLLSNKQKPLTAESQSGTPNQTEMKTEGTPPSKRIEMPEDDMGYDEVAQTAGGVESPHPPPPTPKREFNPLDEAVEKKAYQERNLNPVGSQEPYIPEPIINRDHVAPPPDIGEGIGGNKSSGTNNTDTGASGIHKPISPTEKTYVNPELKDLSNKQKKEAAEKTADAILKTYSELFPIIPLKVTTFNMRKLERWEMEGKIDLSFEIDTGDRKWKAKEYMLDKNSKMEQVFKVSEETRLDIREPLIEVLMEKGIAATPMQRLLWAVGNHLFQTFILAMQFMQQRNMELKLFVQFHEEAKVERKARNEAELEILRNSQRNQQPQAKHHERKYQEPVKSPVGDEVTNNTTQPNSRPQEEVKPSTTQQPAEKMTADDVITATDEAGNSVEITEEN